MQESGTSGLTENYKRGISVTTDMGQGHYRH